MPLVGPFPTYEEAAAACGGSSSSSSSSGSSSSGSSSSSSSQETPTCLTVPPESLPNNLFMTLIGPECICAQENFNTGILLRDGFFGPNTWFFETDAGCGQTSGILFKCIDNQFQFSITNTYGQLIGCGGGPPGPDNLEYFPVSGTTSPFSLTYEVDACGFCEGATGTLTLIISDSMGMMEMKGMTESVDTPLFCYEFVNFDDCYKVYGDRCKNCDFEAMYGVIE